MAKVLADLKALLGSAHVQHSDCVCVLGGFNCRLPTGRGLRVAKGKGGLRGAEAGLGALTGPFCVHPRPDEAGSAVLSIMREFGLYASSTHFKPTGRGKKGTGTGCATYLPAGFVPATKKRRQERSGREQLDQLDYILTARKLLGLNMIESSRVCWGAPQAAGGGGSDASAAMHGLVEMVMRETPNPMWEKTSENGGEEQGKRED